LLFSAPLRQNSLFQGLQLGQWPGSAKPSRGRDCSVPQAVQP
jgi:hypothetical protein